MPKAIILIRDDVERMLSSRGADIAKIFSSYATRLDWYQEEQNSENDTGLKKLVERRSKYAFEKAGISVKGKYHGTICLLSLIFHQKLVLNTFLISPFFKTKRFYFYCLNL